MKIWLVKMEEELPIDENFRLGRMGNLSDILCQRGHYVVRWTSDFIHRKKKKRFCKDQYINFTPNLKLNILNGIFKYRDSHSLFRWLNNMIFAYKFYKIAKLQEKPDLIVCSMPTIELALLSSKLGNKFQIPVILDARDLWPDIFKYELFGLKK